MTNQERLRAGLELSHGDGERTTSIVFYPKFVYFGGGVFKRLPTKRFRKYPKSERMSRRQYLKSEQRAEKITEKRLESEY